MPEFSYKECLKKIKEYLANKHTSSQLVNLFITRYLLQSEECNISKGIFYWPYINITIILL
jgi:hypothetical protein